MQIHTAEHLAIVQFVMKHFQNRDTSSRMRNNTGEKLYSCSICDKAFSESEHFQSHAEVYF